MNKQSMKATPLFRSGAAAAGFSLLELMVAMAMFMVIGAAAMSLVKAHMPMASSTANQAGLTMNLRNALSQVELDAVNAGTSFFPGANFPDWPVGFTIVNSNTGAACNNAVNYTYGATCFDTLNIIAGDSTIGALHPAAAVNLETQGTADISTPNPTALAAALKQGDELLWVSTGSPPYVTTTVLTQPPVANAAAGTVTLTFNSTTTVQAVMGPPPLTIHGINATDPYLIAAVPPTPDTNVGNSMSLGSQFATTDWVMRITPITYTVDLTNPANPKLVRKQNGNTDIVAEQIIGFRVGASTRFNNATSTTYNFASNQQLPSPVQGCPAGGNCGYNNDWAQIRAVRVSVIGRTPPNSDIAINYHNSFDQGPYKIQGLSVTINPRNLSMTDQ